MAETKTTRHIIGDMDNGIQRCIICGEELVNYQGCYSSPGGSIEAWRTGDFYVSDGWPKQMSTEPPSDGNFINCK